MPENIDAIEIKYGMDAAKEPRVVLEFASQETGLVLSVAQARTLAKHLCDAALSVELLSRSINKAKAGAPAG